MISGHLLYSANVWLKWHVQQEYRGQAHYVWCSACFDPALAVPLSGASHLPPSSSPIEICKDLYAAVQKGDSHCPKIREQQSLIVTRAAKWEADGEISADERDDIVYLAEKLPDFRRWRPLLYVIPRALVESRMKSVPMSKRAGIADEFIVENLRMDEFDVIEWRGV